MSIDGFRRHLTSTGCAPCPNVGFSVIADDKVHRYKIDTDKPGRVSGAYQVREDADGFCVGWCKDWRDGQVHTYTSSYKRGASYQERQDNKERREREREAQKERDADERKATAERAARLWSVTEPADATVGYLARKGIGAGPARAARGLLVVPVYVAGELSSLQYIQEDGGKRFLKGRGSTDGGYCVWDGTRDVVYVCEGFATAGSVHAATGAECVVAFNAGNLIKVAQWASGEYTGSRVVICADNDINGDQEKITSKTNPGRFWAMQAASKAGGMAVVFPDIHGDFNDLHIEAGLDAVRSALDAVAVVSEPEPVDDVGDWVPDYEPGDSGGSGNTGGASSELLASVRSMVRPLGYDDGLYYFLPRVTGQIVKLKPTELSSINNLYQLGNLYDWQGLLNDYEIEPNKIPGLVTPALMHLCHSRGVYNPEIVRGAGAWPDGNSAVVNLGDTVYKCSEKKTVSHNDMTGNEVYVRSTGVYNLDCEPLRNAEANRLRQICDRLTWKRGMNGTLLAGWLVLAPIGGALWWRPHIFLTGSKGAGKSTVINDIVMRMLDRMAIKMDGGSTEAGLRGAVKESTRPVIMDEFEGENKRDAEQVDKILNWARKGSSGGVITNANGSFRARSCVCFAAINPLVIKDADVERNTILELDVNRSKTREADYSELLDMIHETLTPEYASRMVRRTVDNIDTLLHNCGVFIKHTSRILGSKRAGDQIGTLLAGAYMLNSTSRVTEEKAEEWVASQDWSWHEDAAEGSDTENLMQYILTALVDHTTLDRTGKMPIAELIIRVSESGTGHEDAAKTLGRFGLAVADGWLRIANKSNRLSELLSNTIYHVYKPTLNRYPGVRAGDAPMRFAPGVMSRYMEVPLDGLMNDYVAPVVSDWDDEEPF